MNFLKRLLGRGGEPPASPLTPELAREIRASFEEAARDEEHFPSTIDSRIEHVRLVVREFAALPSPRIADVGSGKGRYSRVLAAEIPGARLVCADLSLGMLAHVNPPLAPCAASMLALPFRNGAFDAAFAIESLEHAVDIPAAVAELCRIVRPGGRIAVIDKNREQWGRLETPSWERWFTAAELEKLLRRHCREVRCRPISYWADVEPDGLFLAWTASR